MFCILLPKLCRHQRIFNALLNLLSPSLPDCKKLPKFAMVLMFLMKIRLGLYNEDLAYRFGVHKSTLTRCFHAVLEVAAAKAFLH